MRLITLTLLALFSVASFAQDQFTQLFDGKSLEGWTFYLEDESLKMQDVWHVEDGLLVCKGEPMGYLATEKEYTNYKLIAEWRWAPGTPAGNSGVLMRITGEPKKLPKCYEAQLKHGSVGDIYGFHGNTLRGPADRYMEKESELVGKMAGVSKAKDNESGAGDWNRYEIYLLDGNLTVYLNGEWVNEANGVRVRAGKIGFQSEGGIVQFRKIELLPLDPEKEYSWPQFHGPDRNNRSKETGLLTEWPAQGPELLWTAKNLGSGYSSLSISDGRIFTAGNVGDQTIVMALNLQGEELWRMPNGKAWEDSYPGTRGTPTVDGDRVYHQNPLGTLTCFEASTGEIIWQTNVLDLVNSKTTKWALSESLLIDGDRVISSPGGPEASMIALNKMTGELIWKTESTDELAAYSSPILFEYQGYRIIANLTAKGFIGVDADQGTLLWHVKHESYADENVIMPIYADGCLFVSTLKAGSVKWAIEVENGEVTLKELWRSEEMDNHHGDVALIDGYLYGTSTFYNRDKWVCLNWETGEKQYVTEGTGKSSLTFVDDKLITLSVKGLVGLVKPSPEAFEVLSTFQLPKGGAGPSWAHPVICNGKLYIRHGEFLYVYKVK